jgi:hypothetical protein
LPWLASWDDDEEHIERGEGADVVERVLHHPRLAWDGARVIVRVLESDQLYAWLSQRLVQLFGAPYQQALSDSFNRLWWTERVDAPQAEAGLWRARLADALTREPHLAPALQELIYDANARLAEPPVW